MALTKDQILQSVDIQIEKVDVPEWGGEVFVKSLTASERDKYESNLADFTTDGKVRKLHIDRVRIPLAAMCLCDEDGKRLFEDADVAKLGEKSAKALARVIEVAQRLSAVTDDDIQELADGLKNDQPADLPSD